MRSLFVPHPVRGLGDMPMRIEPVQRQQFADWKRLETAAAVTIRPLQAGNRPSDQSDNTGCVSWVDLTVENPHR